MKTKHTQGKLIVDVTNKTLKEHPHYYTLRIDNELTVLIHSDPNNGNDQILKDQENVKHLQKCWNIHDEMLEALNNLLLFHVKYFKGSAVGAEYRNKAEQAIKKATS